MKLALLDLLRREPGARPTLWLVLTVGSALATVAVIACVSAGAELASRGEVSLRLAGLVIIATALYALVQNTLMFGFAERVEAMIHRLRNELFSAIRVAEPDVVHEIGRAPLFAAITQDTQTISRNLPLLVIGLQQFVLVVFICLYLATLSLTAFLFAAAFSFGAVRLHLYRMKALGIATGRAVEDEGRLFDGLGGLLHGMASVRMRRARADALLDELHVIGAEARAAKGDIKKRWGREFALIQLAFYLLVGLMVFAVPLLTEDFHEVALAGVMAALFLIGPIGTVATAVPVVDDAERALAAIRSVQHRLTAGGSELQGDAARGSATSREVAGQPDEDDGGTSATAEAAAAMDFRGVRELRLEAACFQYRSVAGEPGFGVGPLDVSFRAGEITFITGGNGSGKSTMLQLVTGLARPQAGRILVDGVEVQAHQAQAWRDCIAAVFSDYHLFATLYGVPPASLARVPDLLALLEMDDKVSFDGRGFSTVSLSSGQRKRLALIAAMLEDKPVLILDEWAADQDPHFRRIFYEHLLPDLRAQGRMVICVTHDDRWFDIADQVLAMEEGQFRAPPERGEAGIHPV